MYANGHPYSIYPIQDKTSFAFFESLVQLFWSHKALDYSKDREGYETLTPDLKKALDSVLSFFAVSDSVVNENIAFNFYTDAPTPELKLAYSMQEANEAIHAVTYNELINTMVLDRDYKEQLFKAVVNSDVIQQKIDFAEKYMQRPAKSLGETTSVRHILAFMCVEGIFFSTSFAFIYWLQDHFGNMTSISNKTMPALFQSNEYIARDEALHTRIAGHALGLHGGVWDVGEAHDIIREAVEVESVFVREVFPDTGKVLTKDNMIDHVKVCANVLCEIAGIPLIPEYEGIETKFKSLLGMVVPSMNSFFERHNSSYELPVNDGLVEREDF